MANEEQPAGQSAEEPSPEAKLPAEESAPVEPAPVEPAPVANPAAEGLSPEAKLQSDAAFAREFETEAAPMMVSDSALPPEVEGAITGGFGQRFADFFRKNPYRAGGWVLIIVALIVGFFWPDVPKPHVSLGGEPIASWAPWWLTNTTLTILIVDLILLILALATRFSLKIVPGGLQNAMELILEYIFGLAEQVAGRAARSYFPWVMTIFLLVILSNWTGLIPGVGSIGFEQIHTGAEEGARTTSSVAWNPDAQLAMSDGALILLADDQAEPTPDAAPTSDSEAAGEEAEAAHFVPLFRAPSADLNFTFALAISTMVMVQIWGVRALGGSYFKKFFNASGKGAMKGISVFVGILELISEIARILTFGFRLFGNIFAGEVVLATMAFLAAFVLPLPFYVLEAFVGFVQAFVFCMLALVFFSMATQGHGDDGHHEESHSSETAEAGLA